MCRPTDYDENVRKVAKSAVRLCQYFMCPEVARPWVLDPQLHRKSSPNHHESAIGKIIKLVDV